MTGCVTALWWDSLLSVKTVFGEWVLFQQIINGGGLLWIDGKLDPDKLYKLDAMCAYAGRRSDLLVINAGDPNLTNSYNPILSAIPTRFPRESCR